VSASLFVIFPSTFPSCYDYVAPYCRPFVSTRLNTFNQFAVGSGRHYPTKFPYGLDLFLCSLSFLGASELSAHAQSLPLPGIIQSGMQPILGSPRSWGCGCGVHDQSNRLNFRSSFNPEWHRYLVLVNPVVVVCFFGGPPRHITFLTWLKFQCPSFNLPRYQRT